MLVYIIKIIKRKHLTTLMTAKKWRAPFSGLLDRYSIKNITALSEFVH